MSSSNSEVLFSCTVASGLFASMLYLSFHPEKDDVLQAFMDTLNKKQKKLYIKIKNERAQIYFLGLIVSLLIGFIYLNNTRKSDTRTCVFVSMVLGITILFYLLYLGIYLGRYSRTHLGYIHGYIQEYLQGHISGYI